MQVLRRGILLYVMYCSGCLPCSRGINGGDDDLAAILFSILFHEECLLLTSCLQYLLPSISCRTSLCYMVDLDECQSPDACRASHVCNNTVGSYRCECLTGFATDSGAQDPLDPVCIGKICLCCYG